MATMHRWKYSALAAAAVASFGLYSSNALALALGPITVQSALGEPLRAEIELVQVTSGTPGD
jgi:pilus assembly protein FimV